MFRSTFLNPEILEQNFTKKTLSLWQYFTSTSNPLLSCKEGMIYSQALRYNMIISEGSIPQEELNNITHILLDCAYPLHLIIQNIKRPSFKLAVSLWNPPWRGEGAYLTKRFQTCASTRRTRQSDAATFD